LKGLGKASSSAAIKQAALRARSSQLNTALSDLGKQVSAGTLSVDQATKAYNQYKESLPTLETEDAAQKTTDWRGALTKAGIALGVATTAAIAAKKAFDMGAEGAQILRTRDAFERLAESVGESSQSMLDSMREATAGMVSDTDLMQSTSRLLAMGLATTADEAAKLNETAVLLGSAMGKGPTEAMEEFALLLANTSIPRLDTFGISAGKVRTRIKELRDETPGLTRETAFMQATMEQAAISAEKLGGKLEPDPYSKTQAEIENLTDELKVFVSEGLGPAISVVSDFLTAQREAREETKDLTLEFKRAKVASRDLGEALGLTGMEMSKLRNKILRELTGEIFVNKVASEDLAKSNQVLRIALRLVENGAEETGDALADLALETYLSEAAAESLTKAYAAMAKAEGRAVENTGEVTGALEDLEESAYKADAAIREMTGAERAHALRQMTRGTQEWYDAQKELGEAAEEAGEKEKKAAEEAAEAEIKHAEALADLKRAAKAVRAALGSRYVSALDAIISAHEEGEAVTNDFGDSLFRQATAAGAPTAALIGLARETGNYTDAQIRAALKTAAVQTKIQDLAQAVADGKITWMEARDELDNYIDSLDRVPTEVHTTFTWDFSGPPPPDLIWPGGDPTGPIPRGDVAQHGLDMIVPPGFHGDKYPIWTSSGERVIVQTAAQQKQGGGGGDITLHYYAAGGANARMDARRMVGFISDAMGTRG
jgi:hypothetical protein